MNLKLLRVVIFLIASTSFAQSKLVMSYDASGNQTQRYYCDNPITCTPPTPPTEIEQPEEQDIVLQMSKVDESKFKAKESIEIFAYPNPTSGMVYVESSIEFLDSVQSIEVYNSLGVLIKRLDRNNIRTNLTIDLNNNSSGVYVINLNLRDNSIISKRIIKE